MSDRVNLYSLYVNTMQYLHSQGCNLPPSAERAGHRQEVRRRTRGQGGQYPVLLNSTEPPFVLHAT